MSNAYLCLFRHARPLPRVESMPTPASMYTGNSSANDTTHSDTKVANLSKLNGSVPTIKTYSLPPGVTKGQRVTYNNDVSRNLPNGGAVNSTHTTTATAVSSNMASSRNGSLVSFSNTSSCTQATIPEELSAGDTSLAVNKGDLSCHQSDKSLTLPDEYESDDGRQYELLALPIFPPEEGSSDSSDSDSSSDLDSSRDDLGGIESLFGLTSTGSSRGSSDGSSSDDEEDSFHEQQRLQDELRSELHEIILSNIANDSARSNSLTSVWHSCLTFGRRRSRHRCTSMLTCSPATVWTWWLTQRSAGQRKSFGRSFSIKFTVSWQFYMSCDKKLWYRLPFLIP